MPEHIIALDWSSETLVNKLKAKHGLEWYDVDKAVKWHRYDEKWVVHKKYGKRLRVEALVEQYNMRIIVYLKPVNRRDGIWLVKTAFEKEE